MSITSTTIAAVITAGRAALPGAIYTIRWGGGAEHEVSAFQPDGRQHDPDGSVDGLIAGTRGTLIITLSDCDPWEPPTDNEGIVLLNASGENLGAFAVLGHRDDPTGTIRRLFYGEEAA